jgi:hypothetical protein
MQEKLEPYVVKQGDYLTKLAHVHGFDAEAVWGHEKNRALREAGRDPDILAPGDILYIPRKPRPELPLATGTTNRYRARVPRIDVKLVLRDAEGSPMADEVYRVEGLGAPQEGKTGPDGSVAFTVPVHIREVSLLLPRHNLHLPVRVGHLDPITTRAGVAMRLAHLSFLAEDAAPSDEDLSRAIAAFQRSQGAKATGVLDEETRRALEQAHGS